MFIIGVSAFDKVILIRYNKLDGKVKRQKTTVISLHIKHGFQPLAWTLSMIDVNKERRINEIMVHFEI